MTIDFGQIINGIFTAITIGFGTAIGNYLATRHLIEKIKKLKNNNHKKKATKK
jgi:hypothetical protein